jgi:hypothetical protein
MCRRWWRWKWRCSCIGTGSPNSPALPRSSTVKKIKKLGKKSGKNKSMKSSGGRNALTGKISHYK